MSVPQTDCPVCEREIADIGDAGPHLVELQPCGCRMGIDALATTDSLHVREMETGRDQRGCVHLITATAPGGMTLKVPEEFVATSAPRALHTTAQQLAAKLCRVRPRLERTIMADQCRLTATAADIIGTTLPHREQLCHRLMTACINASHDAESERDDSTSETGSRETPSWTALSAIERDVLFVLGRGPVDKQSIDDIRRGVEQTVSSCAAESVVDALDVLADQCLVDAITDKYTLSEQGRTLLEAQASRLHAIVQEDKWDD